jgi:branched-chain amino acid transport system permease protein
MTVDATLLLNAVASGLLLGCLYAIAASGLAVSFGLVDIVNIAHPAFMVAAAFLVARLFDATGYDPLMLACAIAPAFGLAGAALYRGYHFFFERRGDRSIQGLAFFFGLMFVVEVSLLLVFGADQQWVSASYSTGAISIGSVDLPLRMLVPAGVSLAALGGLFAFLKLTFLGRAIAAVAQDQEALRLMGADPVRVKAIAFAISLVLAALAGGALIVAEPVDTTSGQIFVGRLFAIVIMGGVGSLSGSVIAALLFGLIENLTATLLGPSWSPAVAFGLLLGFLALRPRGLLGAAA